jgi:protein-S-isoprenylcysteine O-methyltransferase Ste14
MSIFGAPYVLLGTLLVSAPILWGWSIVKTILVFAGMLIVAAAIIELQRYLLLKRMKQSHS